MKKDIYTIAIIIAVLCISFGGLLYWHMQEEKAWNRWKQQGFFIIDRMETKRNLGWPQDSILKYGDFVEDSIGRKIPSECPYCFIKHLTK